MLRTRPTSISFLPFATVAIALQSVVAVAVVFTASADSYYQSFLCSTDTIDIAGFKQSLVSPRSQSSGIINSSDIY